MKPKVSAVRSRLQTPFKECKLKKFIAVFVALAMASPALAEKAMPSGVSVISESKAEACEFVDIVSGSKMAFFSVDGARRSVLITVMERAKKKGANAIVINSTSSDNNNHAITATAYSCS